MTTIDSTDVRALEVLADHLQEQGDPRGEFMALQCRQAEGALSAAGRRRLFELRRHHRENLLGDLYGLVTNARFRRGLIHAARLSVTRRRMEATWNSERWSSLEILEVALDGGSWMRKR
jgi:uncharacterized protein (TIGR02996 family)